MVVQTNEKLYGSHVGLSDSSSGFDKEAKRGLRCHRSAYWNEHGNRSEGAEDERNIKCLVTSVPEAGVGRMNYARRTCAKKSSQPRS